MIPKIIHYCWISGDPFPPVIEKCIQSWKEKLPDYQFVLWDRQKARAINNIWLQQCIENRRYAFAADFLRLYSLYHFGGIYLDADVEVIAPFDLLLQRQLFIGMDYNDYFEPAIIGSEPGNRWIEELLNYYQDRHFIQSDGKFDLRPLPDILNESSEKLFVFVPSDQIEYVKEYNVTVYPYDYFSPKSEYFARLRTTPNTLTIHHFEGSWVKRDFKYQLKKKMHQILILAGGRKFHRKTVQLIRKCKDQQ